MGGREHPASLSGSMWSHMVTLAEGAFITATQQTELSFAAHSTHHQPHHWEQFLQVPDNGETWEILLPLRKTSQVQLWHGSHPSFIRGAILSQDSPCLLPHSSRRKRGPVSADAGDCSARAMCGCLLCLFPSPATIHHSPVYSSAQELCHGGNPLPSAACQLIRAILCWNNPSCLKACPCKQQL